MDFLKSETELRTNVVISYFYRLVIGFFLPFSFILICNTVTAIYLRSLPRMDDIIHARKVGIKVHFTKPQ